MTLLFSSRYLEFCLNSVAANGSGSPGISTPTGNTPYATALTTLTAPRAADDDDIDLDAEGEDDLDGEGDLEDD